MDDHAKDNLRPAPGRCTKYNDRTIGRICQLLEQGNSRKTASIGSGINESTFHGWMGKYPDFAEKVEAAEQRCYERHVANIDKHSKGDWRASQFILTRRAPEWADKAPVEVNIEGHGIISVSGLKPEDI